MPRQVRYIIPSNIDMCKVALDIVYQNLAKQYRQMSVLAKVVIIIDKNFQAIQYRQMSVYAKKRSHVLTKLAI